jgi:hypothetical protein
MVITRRCLTIPVDHYASGWNVSDINEFTVPGKYNIATINKISPKVSLSVL